jgi:hypothetical protein
LRSRFIKKRQGNRSAVACCQEHVAVARQLHSRVWDFSTSPGNIDDALQRITSLSQALQKFWSKAHGWAPPTAADGLSEARLDWLASFNKTLKARVEEVRAQPYEAATLIVAWAHLRALVEGNLKFFLTVFLMDYVNDPQTVKEKRTGNPIFPKNLKLEQIRQFLKRKDILTHHERFSARVQNRGNAIHAFSGRDIGTAEEYLKQIPLYLDFLEDIETSFPYPDSSY